MAQPDPRDTEAALAIAAAVVGIVRAVHHGDNMGIIGHLNLLMTTIVEHNKTLTGRPGDEALRRAVAALSR